MKLTWYGHSCFLLESAEGSAVFDPYSPGSVPGLALPELRADAVICSHGHSDHNYARGVTLTGRIPAFGLRQLHVFHDGEGGKLRGENTVTLVEAEGLRVVHLGDLLESAGDTLNGWFPVVRDGEVCYISGKYAELAER